MSSHSDDAFESEEFSSPLHDAANRGDLAEIKHLIREGVDVNALNWEGYCPLLAAVEGGSIDAVKALLDAGAIPNGVDFTLSPLVAAAWRNRADMVELLIRSGADPNRPDPETGDTALMGAAGVGNLGLVEFLLGLGVDAGVRTRKGEDALFYARSGGHAAVVSRLARLVPDSEE
jgi:ankyrin repeat protein